ncbi:LytR/AlgR family response regulator transcription factor [Dyadobacter frigoris]|uniref:Response regulator transcription factor n=1 Tax=Dyadobacter frigoris TaxID=2576211 RepID=A0A4V6BI77_9BACT|nr:LytTR family DNA-binding domain-containing protein [Dyadobacter frigoris]TKT88073.1 response regulator transcription factor [Dyadobacter frigoris]GLU53682.1 DNA-binding response regulator [Dyadobacter frigoris]
MITAMALDDERPALEVLDAFCSQVNFINLKRTFSKTGEANLYLEENPVDLVFLDINMPAVSGIDFYKTMPHPAMVIFTTAYNEYAVESYELDAVDYLLKPFTFDRFLKAVTKAQGLQKLHQQSSDNQERYLYFRVDYSLVKVAITDIIFIEGLDNYLKIHLTGQKPVVVRLTMKAILEKLPEKGFLRVHRSYIVSLDKIILVRNKIIKVGEEEIPLGSSFEEGFNAVFGI